MNEIQKTIAQQINAKELKFAKFQLSIDGKNKIGVKKGQRYVGISYNEGSDTYDVQLMRWKGLFTITQDETTEGVYFDQLQSMIQDHFPSFEYVMERLLNGAIARVEVAQ